jgi:hypothetical protein
MGEGTCLPIGMGWEMEDGRWNLPADRHGMGDGTENRALRTYILQFAIKKKPLHPMFLEGRGIRFIEGYA